MPVVAARRIAIAATASHPECEDASSCDRWADWVERLIGEARIGAMVRELAMQAGCVRIADGERVTTIVLRVERENLRAPALVERLRAALAEALQRPVELVLESGAGEDTVSQRRAAEHSRRQADAEKTIHDDPLVQALLSQYKTARIVPGSVKPV